SGALSRKQNHDRCYPYKAQEVAGRLLVARRNSAKLFHPTPEPFDEIPVLVQFLVILPLLNPIFPWRDYLRAFPRLVRLDEFIAVVSLVADHELWLLTVDECRGLLNVGFLSTGENQFGWFSFSIDRGVNLGTESTARTTESGAIWPPFFPAAC